VLKLIFHSEKNQWIDVKPNGILPKKRQGHAAVMTKDGKMLIFGGSGTEHFLNDLHQYDVGN
jgi:hypothetical protein